MALAENTGQRTTIFSNGSTTIALVFPTAPSAGDLVVCALGWQGDTTVSTPAHSSSLATNTADGTDIDGAIYYKIADGTEGTAWSFTLAASVKNAGVATTYSGADASPLDQTNSNGGTGTAGTTGLTGTLSQAAEVVVTVFCNSANATWASHDNGQTEIGEASSGGSPATRHSVSMGAVIVSATTSVNYGATLSASNDWVAAVATFKEDGGAVEEVIIRRHRVRIVTG